MKLAKEFPGAENSGATYGADGQFDMSRLGRTATIHSRKPLVDQATADQEKENEAEGTLKSKKGTLKSKKATLKKDEEPPKDIYKHPGCFTTLLRIFFGFINFVIFILALVGIGFGLYGQIKFRLQESVSKLDYTFSTDHQANLLIMTLFYSQKHISTSIPIRRLLS